jgi:hypothetical protein
MGFRTESKIIGGLEYRVSQLPVDAGLEVGVCIARALGPALIAIMGGESLATVDKAALGDALAKLSATDLKFVCKVFAEKTFVVDGKNKMPRLDNVWDTHFAGRYKALLEWLSFCVQMNASDFLGSLPSETTAPVASAAAAPSS